MPVSASEVSSDLLSPLLLLLLWNPKKREWRLSASQAHDRDVQRLLLAFTLLLKSIEANGERRGVPRHVIHAQLGSEDDRVHLNQPVCDAHQPECHQGRFTLRGLGSPSPRVAMMSPACMKADRLSWFTCP